MLRLVSFISACGFVAVALAGCVVESQPRPVAYYRPAPPPPAYYRPPPPPAYYRPAPPPPRPYYAQPGVTVGVHIN